MPPGTKRSTSNPTASGSKKKGKIESGAQNSRSTHTTAHTQNGEATEPLMRGDIPDLARGNHHPSYARE